MPRDTSRNASQQELFIGLVRLHVLHHAAEEPIFGLGMMRELGRHGYRLGPGTMYPLLHAMERRGWLRAGYTRVAGHRRKIYTATAAGRRALHAARHQVRELYEEMCAGRQPAGARPSAAAARGCRGGGLGLH